MTPGEFFGSAAIVIVVTLLVADITLGLAYIASLLLEAL